MGLESGPTAIIRNAGGRAMDAMRSIQVLHAINPLGLIVVVHHTGMCWSLAHEWWRLLTTYLDCGTTHVHDQEVRDSINKMTSLDASTVDAMQFGEITE